MVALRPALWVALAATSLLASPSERATHAQRSSGNDLLRAVWNRNVREARSLIERGANVNYIGPLYASGLPPQGHTPDRQSTTALHLACEGRSLILVKLLLVHHAHINAQDQDGNTPLHAATDEGCVQIAQLLLDRGANYSVKNRYGYTPLMLTDRPEQPATAEASEAISRMIRRTMRRDEARAKHPTRPRT